MVRSHSCRRFASKGRRLGTWLVATMFVSNLVATLTPTALGKEEKSGPTRAPWDGAPVEVLELKSSACTFERSPNVTYEIPEGPAGSYNVLSTLGGWHLREPVDYLPSFYTLRPTVFEGLIAVSGTGELEWQSGRSGFLELEFTPHGQGSKSFTKEFKCEDLSLDPTPLSASASFRIPPARVVYDEARDGSFWQTKEVLSVSRTPGDDPVLDFPLKWFGGETIQGHQSRGRHQKISVDNGRFTLFGWADVSALKKRAQNMIELLGPDATGDPNAPTAPFSRRIGSGFEESEEEVRPNITLARCSSTIAAFRWRKEKVLQVGHVDPKTLFVVRQAGAHFTRVEPLIHTGFLPLLRNADLNRCEKFEYVHSHALDSIEELEAIAPQSNEVKQKANATHRYADIFRLALKHQSRFDYLAAADSYDAYAQVTKPGDPWRETAFIRSIWLHAIAGAPEDSRRVFRQWGHSEGNPRVRTKLALSVAESLSQTAPDDALSLLNDTWFTHTVQPTDLALRRAVQIARIELAEGKTDGARQRLADATSGSWLRAVTALVEGGQSDDWARVINAQGEALFLLAVPYSEAADEVTFPKYSGDGSKDDINEFLRTEIGPWYVKKKALIDQASLAYRRVIDAQPRPSPRWTIAAAAEVGRLWGEFVADIRSAPLPKELYYGRLDDAERPAELTSAKTAHLNFSAASE